MKGAVRSKAQWQRTAEMPEPALRGWLGPGPGLDKRPGNMSGGEMDAHFIVAEGRKGNIK